MIFIAPFILPVLGGISLFKAENKMAASIFMTVSVIPIIVNTLIFVFGVLPRNC